MKFHILGTESHLALVQAKFPSLSCELHFDGIIYNASETYVLWDFQGKSIDAPELLGKYQAVFVHSVEIMLLKKITENKQLASCVIFGMNAMASMYERNLLEISSPISANNHYLLTILDANEVAYTLVEDRVGMVTPRVLAMIINEGYYTLMEGTASKKDIDISMRMGTNYPFGPFEYSEKLGLVHVFNILNAMYLDTHDERYKVCPLLAKEVYEAQLASA